MFAILEKWHWLVITLLVLSTSDSSGQVISIDDPEKVYNIGRRIEVLEGTTTSPELSDLIGGQYDGAFIPTGQNIPYFPSDGRPLWCRISLKNQIDLTLKL